jgi:hypothetical protein
MRRGGPPVGLPLRLCARGRDKSEGAKENSRVLRQSAPPGYFLCSPSDCGVLPARAAKVCQQQRQIVQIHIAVTVAVTFNHV